MLLQLIDYYADGNKAKFARLLGIAPQTITTWLMRDTFNNEIVYAKCIGISSDWLLTGKGQMVSSAPGSINQNSGVIIKGDNKNSTIDNRHYYSDSPDVLRAQIDMLDERIKEKDAQIKEKDAQINRLLEILGK